MAKSTTAKSEIRVKRPCAIAPKARVDETVLFIHSRANRDSRPHLIGGHGDFVWQQGFFPDLPTHGLKTWFSC